MTKAEFVAITEANTLCKVSPESVAEFLGEVAWNAASHRASWGKGNKAKTSGNRQAKTLAKAFEAFVGRKPTESELDSMGGSSVLGGV